MCGPTAVGIDGSGSLEDVLAFIHDACDYYGCELPRLPGGSEAAPISAADKRLSTASAGSAESCGNSTFLSEDSFPSGGNRRISVGVYGMYSKM